MERRLRRMRLTQRVVDRRQAEHETWAHDRWWRDRIRKCCCDEGPGIWRKRRPLSCSCRKKHHGAPRRDRGMCDLGARKRVYLARAQARELNRLITLRHLDPWDDEVAILTSPTLRDDLWG